MSEQSIDVFQERKSKARSDDPIAADSRDKGQGGTANKSRAPSTKLVVGVLVVVAITWALWPMFASSTTENTQRQQMLNPAESMIPHPQPVPRQSDETAQKLLQAFEKTESKLIATSKQLNDLREENQAVVAAMRELQAKTALLEQRLTVQEPPRKAEKPKKAPRPAASATVINTKGSDARPGKSADFTINTIYSDQVWLEGKDRTYIVQVGDVIDGLKVLRINAADRTVLTTAGLIR